MPNQMQRHFHNWMAAYHYNMLESLTPEACADKLRGHHYRLMAHHEAKLSYMGG